jgi:hypothetical protein
LVRREAAGVQTGFSPSTLPTCAGYSGHPPELRPQTGCVTLPRHSRCHGRSNNNYVEPARPGRQKTVVTFVHYRQPTLPLQHPARVFQSRHEHAKGKADQLLSSGRQNRAWNNIHPPISSLSFRTAASSSQFIAHRRGLSEPFWRWIKEAEKKIESGALTVPTFAHAPFWSRSSLRKQRPAHHYLNISRAPHSATGPPRSSSKHDA